MSDNNQNITRISKTIISEDFGHSSLKTNEIYLKRFDNTTLKEANERIVA